MSDAPEIETHAQPPVGYLELCEALWRAAGCPLTVTSREGQSAVAAAMRVYDLAYGAGDSADYGPAGKS